MSSEASFLLLECKTHEILIIYKINSRCDNPPDMWTHFNKECGCSCSKGGFCLPEGSLTSICREWKDDNSCWMYLKRGNPSVFYTVSENSNGVTIFNQMTNDEIIKTQKFLGLR